MMGNGFVSSLQGDRADVATFTTIGLLAYYAALPRTRIKHCASVRLMTSVTVSRPVPSSDFL